MIRTRIRSLCRDAKEDLFYFVLGVMLGLYAIASFHHFVPGLCQAPAAKQCAFCRQYPPRAHANGEQPVLARPRAPADGPATCFLCSLIYTVAVAAGLTVFALCLPHSEMASLLTRAFPPVQRERQMWTLRGPPAYCLC